MSKEFNEWENGNKGVVAGIIGGLLAALVGGGIAKHNSNKKKELENKTSDKEIARMGAYSIHKDDD